MNLAPLIARAREIQGLAQQAIHEQIEAKSLRKQINTLFARIRELDCDEAEQIADALLPNHRPSTIQSFQRLKQIAAALEAVLSDFMGEDRRVEMSHQCDISTLPNTKAKRIKKTCSAETRPASQPIRTTSAQIRSLASERFLEYLTFYASGLGDGHASEEQCLVMAARDLALGIGVSAEEWNFSCAALGEQRTALCLLIADRNAGRSDQFRVRDTARAFVGMVRKEFAAGCSCGCIAWGASRPQPLLAACHCTIR
ncbi:hypothetical protein [Paracoccus sp. (in: a-proteobacteria)]|uniref:hypothetical protein n=1 Tax=Paracoccus sp. TaxID=267 RepID=UPI002AFE4B1D|nr:hypothetical protein [Paracoccus sp. (in: a-proteobacteria)]